METTPSTCFLTRGLILGGLKPSQVKLRFHHLPSRNLLSVACKSRPRNSSLYKRQPAKKINLEQQVNTNVESNGDILSNLSKGSTEDSDKESISSENISFEVEADGNTDLVNSEDNLADSYEENLSNENVHVEVEADLNSSLNYSSKDATLDSHKKNINNENVSIKIEADGNSNLNNPSSDSAANPYEEGTHNGNAPTIIEAEISESTGSNNFYPPREVLSLHNDTLGSLGDSSQSEEKKEMDSFSSNDIVPLSTNADGAEQHSGVHLQDLIGMIRHAEKNIHLLNQARMRTIEDLEKVFSEKEALQREITILEMKLTETDARLTVAAQEKIRVEILEVQLENLRKELSSRDSSEEYVQNMYSSVSSSQIDAANYFSQELDSLRAENMSLKDELLVLKHELNSIKGTDERVKTLEKERSVLEFSLKELELKLTASYEDVSKIPSLRSECKTLYEKVEDLQNMLIRATKQADEAILVLKQNEELRKKVDSIEESLKEANSYKLSSEKLQQYNESMQQKIQLLDERLQRSDEEIHSYVQLYQDSVQEFQDTLNDLKEESKKRQQGEAIHDKPWEFWSNLLLMVDGWYIEKKILADEAELLRELIWDKEESVCDAYMSSKGKSEREIIASFLSLTPSTTGERFHVIHIAAEMAPVAKVGGLGDVVTGLGKALQKKGHLVEIILPKYDCMQYESVQDLKALDVPVESYFDGQLFKNKIWLGTVEGLPVYFIEPQHPSKFFWRGEYYGENDDFKRFSFFSRAALELILQAGKKPDIIHCHDWQTAFVAPLYWDLYAPKGLNSARICFTCHNFEYQGTSSASDLASCGLDVHHLNRSDRMQDHSANDRINPVKGAIVFSNIVTTVSPSYAQEVRTSEGGRGLHATLNSHSKKFVGILNGIDTDAWNPATDPFLTSQYNANEIEGKAENKEALRRYLGLSSDNVLQPLVACITRLVPQKGVHLIRHAIYRTLELGGQFVLLGSSPVPQIQREFEEISNYFKSHEHARLILKYDESLSHLIYAASDMFIIPSIFEPCGLTQMIAMRYGAIPIARKTGGLNDSVFDVDDDKVPVQYKNGFTFMTADEQGFNNAIERAFNHYKNDIDGWKELVQKDMNIDFSWDASASLYEGLYENSISRARATTRR